MLFVALCAAAGVGAYLLAGPIDRMFSTLPSVAKILALVAAGACVLVSWYLARDGGARREARAPSKPSTAGRAPVTPPSPPLASSGETMLATVSEDPADPRPVTPVSLADACRAFEESASDVEHVLGQLASVCLLLADRIEENRRSNRALAELLLGVDVRAAPDVEP
jgi:hypothetical protein